MTYPEMMAGLQLIAERDIGRPNREQRAIEDARMHASTDALKRSQEESL